MADLGRVNAGLRLADGLRWSVLGKNIIEKMCKKAGCGEAPQAGANMASAIFGGILVLEREGDFLIENESCKSGQGEGKPCGQCDVVRLVARRFGISCLIGKKEGRAPFFYVCKIYGCKIYDRKIYGCKIYGCKIYDRKILWLSDFMVVK